MGRISKKQPIMQIGDRVMTPDGSGQIVLRDLPEAQVWQWTEWRWIVQLDVPRQGDSRDVLCYFERELKKEANDE